MIFTGSILRKGGALNIPRIDITRYIEEEEICMQFSRNFIGDDNS